MKIFLIIGCLMLIAMGVIGFVEITPGPAVFARMACGGLVGSSITMLKDVIKS